MVTQGQHHGGQEAGGEADQGEVQGAHRLVVTRRQLGYPVIHLLYLLSPPGRPAHQPAQGVAEAARADQECRVAPAHPAALQHVASPHRVYWLVSTCAKVGRWV